MEKQGEEKVYVSRLLKYGFQMPLVIDGEPQYKKDQNGGKIISNGKFLPEMISIEFTNVSSSIKLGYYSELKTSDPAIIKYIEENLLKIGAVMTLDKYKQDKNPELWRSEQEKKAIIAEKAAMAAEKSSYEKQLAEMREKVERLQNQKR